MNEETIGMLREQLDESRRNMARALAGVEALRDAIHAFNRPDEALDEGRRRRWRDMCDAILEGKGPSDPLWP